jgi:hypothetical protein
MITAQPAGTPFLEQNGIDSCGLQSGIEKKGCASGPMQAGFRHNRWPQLEQLRFNIEILEKNIYYTLFVFLILGLSITISGIRFNRIIVGFHTVDRLAGNRG